METEKNKRVREVIKILIPSIDMIISSNKPMEETIGQKDNTERHTGLIILGPDVGLWEHYKMNPLNFWYFKESLHHALKKEANAPPEINCYETTQENATSQPNLSLQLGSINSSNKTCIYCSFLTSSKKNLKICQYTCSTHYFITCH